MNIFIPSYKRTNLIIDGTLAYIPDNLLRTTYIVVRTEELEIYTRTLAKHRRHREMTKILAFDTNGISNKRLQIAQYCVKHNIDNFIMMDDDLLFYRRLDPSTTKLIPASHDDMNSMVTAMRRGLTNFSHVGISIRGGNNQGGVGSADMLVEQNTRCIRAVAFRTKDYADCDIDRINGMEDLDVSLQLLRKGKKNLNLFWWAQDQGMTNAPGGCSEWRTQEYHTNNAKKLAELHSPFVKIVEKNNITGGDFGKRTEVRIQWKAAYEEGRIKCSPSKVARSMSSIATE